MSVASPTLRRASASPRTLRSTPRDGGSGVLRAHEVAEDDREPDRRPLESRSSRRRILEKKPRPRSSRDRRGLGHPHRLRRLLRSTRCASGINTETRVDALRRVPAEARTRLSGGGPTSSSPTSRTRRSSGGHSSGLGNTRRPRPTSCACSRGAYDALKAVNPEHSRHRGRPFRRRGMTCTSTSPVRFLDSTRRCVPHERPQRAGDGRPGLSRLSAAKRPSAVAALRLAECRRCRPGPHQAGRVGRLPRHRAADVPRRPRQALPVGPRARRSASSAGRWP